MIQETQGNLPYQLPYMATLKASVSCPPLFMMPPFSLSLEQSQINYNGVHQGQNTSYLPMSQQFSIGRQPIATAYPAPAMPYMPFLPTQSFNLMHNSENTRKFYARNSFQILDQIPRYTSLPNAPASPAGYSDKDKDILSSKIEAKCKRHCKSNKASSTKQKVKSKSKMPENEDSVGNDADDTIIKRLLSGEAYKSRNVYKTIIRHMHTYTRRNRDDFIRIVQISGFTMQDVEHAFCKIDYWCNIERESGNRNYAQGIVKKIFAKRTIYTIVLRETLNALLLSWRLGNFGKIIKKNRDVYFRACQKFYDETVNILDQPAQGVTFDL